MKVVVMHGLYMPSLIMVPLCRQISDAGHQVLNLGYKTTEPDTKHIFSQIDDFLTGSQATLIGHSMGGIIARTYLDERGDRADNVKAVITLGTPHQGAKVAEFVTQLGLQDVMLKKSADYLLPNKAIWRHKAKLFSLAGNLPLGVLALLQAGTESDGTVLMEETMIEGMTRHQTFKSTHTSMLYSKDVTQTILDILENEV